MRSGPMTSNFSRLLHDLSLREGEDLERALADSASMFARLGACAAPRVLEAQQTDRGALCAARAERELSRLIVGEVERLCEQAAVALDQASQSHRLRRELCELLLEELDCAQSMDCLPRSMIEHVRDLALHLARAACESGEFRAAAASIRALSSAAFRA